MLRLNIFLLLVAVACALLVVTAQHKARKLFQELEVAQQRERQLEVEFGQLQIEISTLATASRIDRIARAQLKMDTPSAASMRLLGGATQ